MRPFATLAMAVAFATLVVLACSEHDTPGPDAGDHMAPSVADVIGWDINHVVLAFDEPVTRETGDIAANYQIVERSPKPEGAAAAVALAPSAVLAASLHSDNRTVTLTTIDLEDRRYALIVTGVSDVHGNEIVKPVDREFEGINADDTTPPEVVFRIPGPAASGVSTQTLVFVGFTEPVQSSTVFGGLDVTGEGARLVSMQYDDLLRYTCDLDVLQTGASYTVALSGIRDLVGNTMPNVQWTFTTAVSGDTRAPTVVSSRPGNNLVNVFSGEKLTINFSEPVDPYSLRVRPPFDFDAKRWSNGFRRLTFETTWPGGKQYTIQIRPGEMVDWSGNAGSQLFTLTFSTAASLEPGSFRGSITGDPHSTSAMNPGGGLVFAGKTSPYDLYTSVVGMVTPSGSYELPHLPAGLYFPFYVKDTNGDRMYQPNYGDAVGIFGISDWQANQQPLTVEVGAGEVPGIDFNLFDPTAVYGNFTYHGNRFGPIHLGLFDTEDFDPSVSVPVISILAEWNGVWDYVLNTLEIGPIPDGEYFVAAYTDFDRNGVYDPSNDPIGVYGGASPIAIDLSQGRDAGDISFEVFNPPVSANASAVAWPQAPGFGRLKQFVDETKDVARD